MTIRRLLIIVVEGEKEAIEALCTTVHNIGKVLTPDIKVEEFTAEIPDSLPVHIFAEIGSRLGGKGIGRTIHIPLQDTQKFKGNMKKVEETEPKNETT